jgi:hypothetical protein
MAADRLRDRQNGLKPLKNRKIVLVDWTNRENAVDEKQLLNGFSDFRSDTDEKGLPQSTSRFLVSHDQGGIRKCELTATATSKSQKPFPFCLKKLIRSPP